MNEVPSGGLRVGAIHVAAPARGPEGPRRGPERDLVSLIDVSTSLPTTFPLSTDRLVLRPHEPSDADWLLSVYSRPDVATYLLDDPWTEEVAQRKSAERLTRIGLDSPARALTLIVEHEGAPVGEVLLWYTDHERGVAEIGWVLDPEHGGKGFASEAVGAVLDLAFSTPGMHRVAAQMDGRNTTSARLAERVGMRREAHLRQDWWNKGEWTDTVVFGMLASDRS
ncbi:GNAT family N-acetyltransferase [Plantibacter sp. VKM Ac-2876]|nr:GNAT family N-acetyltransferase [Plantibacter sp. VKM Ac-2876]